MRAAVLLRGLAPRARVCCYCDYDGECARRPDKWLALKVDSAMKKRCSYFECTANECAADASQLAQHVRRLPRGVLLLARMPGRAPAGAQEDVQEVDDKFHQDLYLYGRKCADRNLD